MKTRRNQINCIRFTTTFCAILICALSSGLRASGELVKIGSYPIPLMVEDADTGVFVELTKAIAEKAGVEVEVVVMPTKRTLKSFADGEIAGFFPGLDVILPTDAAKSSEIYVKKDFGFVREGDTVPATIMELEGKKVGLTLGYPYVTEISANDSLDIENANDDILNMKKLSGKRIDVFVVEEKSGLKALELSERTDIIYDPDHPLSEQKVYYAFQKTPEGEALAKKFSDALDALKADGTFGKIMAKAAAQE